jgi:hypothetical protein
MLELLNQPPEEDGPESTSQSHENGKNQKITGVGRSQVLDQFFSTEPDLQT